MCRGEKTSVVRSWALRACVLSTVALGCGGSGNNNNVNGPGLTETETFEFITRLNTEVDLLFVIDNGSETSVAQQKLNAQLPAFMGVLENLPNPLDLHVAVVTTDMGAPSDSPIGCTTYGDQGVFRSAPTGTCTSTGLASGVTYLSSANGVTDFTGQLPSVLQCISLVGATGCGFRQPLAALARALGADGQPPPSANGGFLRPEAYLAIILLTNEDDCSAPANTELFSLNGGQQNLTNPLGPLGHYRCNQFGHLCQDASGELVAPPLNPPSGAQGTAGAPTLDLASCTSNDTGTGLLTPVTEFVTGIRALKADPDNQILVAAIAAPPSPYAVAWLPPVGGQNTRPGELWPEIEHSCGAAGASGVNPEATISSTDGSWGDPAVRIAEFVSAFPDSTLTSICDPSYAPAMQAIATKVGALPQPPCLPGKIQLDAAGLPDCSVVAHFTTPAAIERSEAYQNCGATGNTPPCWTLEATDAGCSGEMVQLNEAAGAQSEAFTVSCALCVPGVPAPGC